MSTRLDLPPPAELVPHRGTSLLLRHLVEQPEAGVLIAMAAVSEDHPAVSGGRCTMLLAIEMAAQAAAALEVLERRRAGVRSGPQVGYLVALSGFELAQAELLAGVEHRVTVQQEAAVPPLARYLVKVEREGEVQARGTLSVWERREKPTAPSD